MVVKHNPQAVDFLKRVRSEYGDDVCRACERSLEASADESFDPVDVLQDALNQFAEDVATTGIIHRGAMQRCNSSRA